MSIKIYRPLNRAPHEYEEYDESMSRRTIEQNFHLSGNERIEMTMESTFRQELQIPFVRAPYLIVIPTLLFVPKKAKVQNPNKESI